MRNQAQAQTRISSTLRQRMAGTGVLVTCAVCGNQYDGAAFNRTVEGKLRRACRMCEYRRKLRLERQRRGTKAATLLELAGLMNNEYHITDNPAPPEAFAAQVERRKRVEAAIATLQQRGWDIDEHRPAWMVDRALEMEGISVN
jgi:hypothetical protein